MRVSLNKGRPATQEQIAALEALLGEPIIASFRDFLREHDGAEPDSNTFSVGEDNNSGVRAFIPPRTFRVKVLTSKTFHRAHSRSRTMTVATTS